jgi:DHA1 family bicyclomycin/chloramphenicol resistance-like MFS transporter
VSTTDSGALVHIAQVDRTEVDLAAVDTPYSSRQRLKLVLVLGALIALGPLTIDMYLPALPSIATDLETTSSTIQLTLTGTLLGLAFGQLLIGPISDAVGRKGPLLAGTALHVLASVMCLIAPNVELLGAARVLQGLGASAGAVLALAMIRDLFDGRAAATLLSRLILVMGAAPIVAPTLGGLLLRWTQWRGVFAALAVLGAVILSLAVAGLTETLPPQRRRRLAVLGTLKTYGGLLRDWAFVGLVLVAGFAMAALFGYVAGASFVFQQQFGLNQQQFGLLFGAGAVWLIAATQLNPRLLRRYEPRQILVGAAVAASLAGVLLVIMSATGAGGLLGVVLPLWAVLFGAGLMLPNAPVLALSRHGEAAGTAAALLGAVQFGVGALISPLVGVLGNDALAMAAVVAGGMLLATTLLVLLARSGRLGSADQEGRTLDDVEADRTRVGAR